MVAERQRRADEVLVGRIVAHRPASHARQVERVAAARIAREQRVALPREIAACSPDVARVVRASRAVLIAAAEREPLHRNEGEADAREVVVDTVDADQLEPRVQMELVAPDRTRPADIADVMRVVAGSVAVARTALVAQRRVAELERQPRVRADDPVPQVASSNPA